MSPQNTPNSATPIASHVQIGSIVSSNGHLDYVVDVLQEQDCESPPQLDEREFGQPVVVPKTVGGTDHLIFGVIYDTQLVDPDTGRAGPRLSTDQQERFNPGYAEEQTTLLGIALLGTAKYNPSTGLTDPTHSMPPYSLDVNDPVYYCPDTLTGQFHRLDGAVTLGYVDRLIEVADEFGIEVATALITRLQTIYDDPEAQDLLSVVKTNLERHEYESRGLV